MNASTNHNALAMADTGSREVSMGFMNAQSFELMQRAARLLSSSTLVPAAYRAVNEKRRGSEVELVDNPSALSNCVVALNMAGRMGADPLMVMQNLYIVEGRPSWSSQWIIAAINGCGRFSPLRFDLEDLGEQDVEYTVTEWVDRQKVNKKIKTAVRNLRCTAWATEKATGARIDSPKVDVAMAVREGWFGKTGSKWQTMPEVMLRYRTASFFGKLYAPELLMGMQSTEEEHDILTLAPDGSVDVPGKPEVAMPRARAAEPEPVRQVDQETGEIQQQPQAEQAAPQQEPAKQQPEAQPEQAQKKPAPAPQPGVMATDGERKLIIKRAQNNNLVLADLVKAAGLDPLPDDLAGLTKDGFLALREQLPAAA